jgi:DNA-binding protein YbaB
MAGPIAISRAQGRKMHVMDNDALRHDFTEILALVQQQMHGLEETQHKQDALSAKGIAADGLVAVTVDSRRMVTDVDIDESYLKDFEFAELGAHVASAAGMAVQEVERQAAELMAPMTQRREAIWAATGALEDMPDLADVFARVGVPMPNAAHPKATTDDGERPGGVSWVRG